MHILEHVLQFIKAYKIHSSDYLNIGSCFVYVFIDPCTMTEYSIITPSIMHMK